jgi:hypothetical protein
MKSTAIVNCVESRRKSIDGVARPLEEGLVDVEEVDRNSSLGSIGRHWEDPVLDKEDADRHTTAGLYLYPLKVCMALSFRGGQEQYYLREM